MLIELRVRNFAVVADVTVTFSGGLNVLTGETGAGKSILVDALSLLLGERASGELVRPGANRAVIEAAFDVEGSDAAHRAADECGISIEDGHLVVRREINTAGRNRAWANGSPTTVGVLTTLGRLLVDLHGQHESQSLLRPAVQRDILDALAGALPERREMTQAFEVVRSLREEEQALEAKRDDVRMRADYLRHVVREIEDVTPLPGEDEQLAQEARRLSHAEELTRLAEEFAELLDGDAQNSASSALGEAGRKLSGVERIDPSVSKWRELLDAATAGVVELARDVRDYASEIEVDPSRLAAVESRRDRLYRLLQKYGDTVEGVLATGQKALEELDLLDSADFDLARIAERRASAEAAMVEVAGRLREKRVEGAGRLASAVNRLLPALGLPQGRLVPRVSSLDAPGLNGADSVEFLVQLNPGMDPRPLAQVASGGELSRIMLALKVVLTDHDSVQTLVFDEVDQGIGGEVGAQVGLALAEVGARRQVLVITHLPQIAARATHHLCVSKSIERGMAATRVNELMGEDRVAEVARMLGDGSDDTLKRHAVALLQKGHPAASASASSPAPRVAGAH